jgi:molybdopterin-guanine dinucleotide biosynthesis protein
MNTQEISVSQSLVFVGSGWRKSGKTLLVCHAIEELSQIAPVTGLKVNLYRKEERNSHPDRYHMEGDDYQIVEELFAGDRTDTARMLQSGAKQAFLIRASEQSLAKAFSSLLEKVPADHIVVAETLSLRDLVKPKLFVMIENVSESNVKATAVRLLPLADLCLQSDKGVFSQKTLDTFNKKLKKVLT